MRAIFTNATVWATPLVVALTLSLLHGARGLEIPENTLLLALPPLVVLGFIKGDGGSPKALLVSALSLSAIPILLDLIVLLFDPYGQLWFMYLLAIPGGCAGAIAANVYDHRSRDQGLSPNTLVLAACTLGSAVVGWLLIALLGALLR